MPRYLTQKGKKIPNIQIQKAWIEISVKTNDNTIDNETYLVQTRVADYIVLLEKNIKGELPKLKIKRNRQ